MPAIETPMGRPVYLGPFQRIVNVAWSIPKQAILSIDVPLDPADYNYVISRFWIELRVDSVPSGETSLGICGHKQPPGESLIPYSIPYEVYDGTPTPWPGGSNLPARHWKRWLANTGSATACGTEVSNFSQRIKENSGGLW